MVKMGISLSRSRGRVPSSDPTALALIQSLDFRRSFGNGEMISR